MKRKLTFILVLLVAVIGVSSATAQVLPTGSITVSAINNGLFVLTIDQPLYAFGVVDSLGTLSSGGTENPGLIGDVAGSIATYTSRDVTTFSVKSAPRRTVRIFNASAVGGANIQWGTADSLRVSIPTTGTGSTSCGFKAFTATGDDSACASGMLVRGVDAGNGALRALGKILFQLDVDGNDPNTGNNSWVVTLTAIGS